LRRSQVLLLGFALDRIAGDPDRMHPVATFGALAVQLERRLWRDARLPGAAYAAALVGGTWLVVRRVPRLELAVLWTVLAGKSLERVALEMASRLENGQLESARELAPSLVGRDPRSLGELDLARAAVESVAENTGDAVIAPLFWFAVGGAPAAAAYRAANTLDSLVGHRSDRHRRFGWAAARLDDALNFVPARLGALAVAAASSREALRVARRDGQRHPSPNAGLYEAAFAGALGLTLGGENRYGGVVERRPTLGAGRLPEVDDIPRATRLALRTSVVFLAALIVALELRR
jgi:adenosylcobinamide-phosphate synthase